MLQHETPIEEYLVNGQTVFVKRDDLFGQYPAPPLAKLRGGELLLKKLKAEGVKKIGVFDTRISKAGQGISYLCKELGLECAVGFPALKGQTELPPQQKIAKELGAILVAVEAGRTAICFARFKTEMELKGYKVLPLGLVCRETVVAVAREADRTLRQLAKDGIKIKTIVVCTGTGTIAAGLALGADAKVIGVSCGMSPAKQFQRMKLLAFPEMLNYDFLELIPPEYEYYTALDTSSCPFPTSPWYDMKAWTWLCDNLEKLKEPCMFWNIGV